MTATRQDERIDARLSRAHKALLKRAADLSGQPISQFLVASALERAQQIIDEHTQTQLSVEAARRFLALIDGAKPNAALVRAAKRYRQRYG
ncbi:MAG: DUF1778 domain-containing protein [Deltaproteobacteria bacterium]|nr:DUF1778 domain-containing protein [Deltaproteobacteria bacterium]